MGRYRRIESCSREETLLIGKDLGEELPLGCLVLLSGSYGVGKTEFVRGIVRGCLGEQSSEEVASPSFSGLFVYENNKRRVLHYDLYRFSSFFTASVFEDAEESDILCVEWSENMGEYIATFREIVKVHIVSTGDNTRDISIAFFDRAQ
ncbi:tRNA (adenosine(37)-N6)-threonylcarbamoyltransferase complex ATPase subunit type 1 TsaE [Chlamydiifrater phoenicopteri]|uniref:tRNA (adenosine(37)-N6)-threonylcarbamoyltransferase complex ATPase subunit type 1 TsaE n=1 Tax=Chlamydiifrater phoenicopteri TaxID=2681469 RepID=UPI001BCB8589|nr:tRNA (adenosine(37)-N6)-threonylcarbamoyltransferase complex ATPase subunit type 1 TsaE [Chlamydiifrater phoenicopteri]